MSTTTYPPADSTSLESGYRRPQRRRAVAAHPVTQSRVIHSEWIKLSTLRSTWLTFAVAVVGLVGVAALAGWAVNAHWSHMSPEDHATFSPITQSLTGVYLAQLAIGVLGALVITGEYATGMIRATLAGVPKRLPVLWAKLAVFCTITLGLCTVAAFGAFLIGQQLLGVHGTTLSAPHALRAVFGVALYLTVVAAIAVGLGFCVRNTAGTIASVFGLLLVLPAIGHVLPTSWQHHVLPYLPSNAGGALYSMHPDPGTLSPWTGFAVMCGWAIASIITGALLLRRRDA